MVQLAITLNLNQTNCSDEWEAKLNEDIRWTTIFKKIQRIQATKLKWFQIRLVHNISYKCCVNAHGCLKQLVLSVEKKEMPSIIFSGAVPT